jgi:hypothetical protein
MIKLGGISEMRARESRLTPTDREGLTEAELAVWQPPQMREKELLREISHLAQQIAVDAAWKKMLFELQPKMDKHLQLRIEDVPKSYKNAPPESAEYKLYCDQVSFKKEVRLALCEVCEKTVRKECHRKLLEMHADIDKSTRVKKCGIASEPAAEDEVPCKLAIHALQPFPPFTN